MLILVLKKKLVVIPNLVFKKIIPNMVMVPWNKKNRLSYVHVTSTPTTPKHDCTHMDEV
jgi:hypothetical protein